VGGGPSWFPPPELSPVSAPSQLGGDRGSEAESRAGRSDGFSHRAPRDPRIRPVVQRAAARSARSVAAIPSSTGVAATPKALSNAVESKRYGASYW